MQRTTWLNVVAPLAVAALALSGCDGGAGASQSSAGSSTALSSPTSSHVPGPIRPRSSSQPPAVPDGPAHQNEADVESASRAFAEANPGYRFGSAGDEAFRAREKESARSKVVFTPASCGNELLAESLMSPDKGFSLTTGQNGGLDGPKEVSFFQVDNPAKLAELKAAVERSAMECAAYQFASGGETSKATTTALTVNVAGADQAWGSQVSITTASGKKRVTTTVFATKGNRGVRAAYLALPAPPDEVQELAAKAVQAWDEKN